MGSNKIKVLGLVNGHLFSHTIRVTEIARGLRETGDYEIIMSGSGPHMSYVEKHGFEWIETKCLSNDELFDSAFNDGVFGFYNDENVDFLYQQEEDLLLKYKPDIILRDSLRELAGIAAKKYNIYDVLLRQANISHFYHFDFIPMNMKRILNNTKGPVDLQKLIHASRKSFSRPLNQKAAQLGLEVNDSIIGGVDADLVLIPDSNILFPADERLDSSYKYIGPPMLFNLDKEPSWKEEFCSSQKKKIVITGGTTGKCNYNDLYSKSLDPEKYCIAMYTNSDDIPPNFYGGKFELTSILKHADLFITHGGLGSVYFGLLMGVPMLSLYNTVELQINAVQTEKIGIGIGLDSNEVTAELLRDKSEEIINNSKMKERAIVIAKMHERYKPVESAVKYIKEGFNNFRNK